MLPIKSPASLLQIPRGVWALGFVSLFMDLSSDLRGASFGLRQSLDTVGAFGGPLIAILLMMSTGDDFRFVFWVAVIPAFIAVGVMIFAVEEPSRHAYQKRPPLKLADATKLGAPFWAVVAVGGVLTLARFSEAFLILRAQYIGVAIAYVPAILVIMNLVYAIAAYPAGVFSDRLGRISLLALGMVFLVVADVILAISDTIPFLLIGAIVWGLHMAFTQGLLATMIADTAPEDLRGTAY